MANQTPSIQLDYGIILDKLEIYDFALDPPKTDFSSPLPTEAGFSIVNPGKLVGTHDVTIFAARREYYAVRQRTNVVGNFKVVVIVEQPVIAAVTSFLLIRDNVSAGAKTKIVTGFLNYDPATNPDPIKYVTANTGADVTSDMFVVRTSFMLHKSGAAKVHDEELEKILALYSGAGESSLFVGHQDNLGHYFLEAGITVNKTGEERVGRVPEPEHDLVHTRQVKNVKDNQETDAAVSDIAKLATPAVEGCRFAARENMRIAAVAAWPEFKIDWVDVNVRIGCINVVFSVPVLRVRISSLVLCAYVVHVDNLEKVVIDTIKGCIVKAALLGAVVGVVFANFPTALAAFEAVFEDCVYFNLGAAAVCMAPGLALLIESSAWT